jgi:hypothetical protein
MPLTDDVVHALHFDEAHLPASGHLFDKVTSQAELGLSGARLLKRTIKKVIHGSDFSYNLKRHGNSTLSRAQIKSGLNSNRG